MAKTRSVIDLKDKLVNHAELQVLTKHISALLTAQDVRLTECERVLAVDPLVGESARDFLARIKGEAGEVIRALSLVDDTEMVPQ